MAKFIDANLMFQQHQEAMQLLNRWCGLFFGRDPNGSHILTDEYVQRHTALFMETAAWLRANPTCERDPHPTGSGEKE